MSDINANIVIAPIDLNVTVSTNQLSFTPEPISLNIYTGGLSTTANGLVANVANVHIYDGSNGYYLQTDGTGNLNWTQYANSNLVNANITNVHISGGINGYVLQTDGSGNLTWTAQTGGGGGNGSPGGSNTQVQYNNAGNFAGNSGFTFNQTTGVLSSQYYAGNANGLFNIIGGNVTGYVANATHANVADSANLIAAANISGQVANALVAGTVYTNAQPNITSVGTLSNLSVNGTTSIYEAIENVAIIGAQTGTYNYNILDGAIQYSTANATASITLNFRGNSSVTLNSFLSNGQSTVGTYLMKTGTTAYGITAINIDGTGQSILWASNNVPTLYSNTTMSYTFTIIKTASSTYSVLGTGVRYG